ncbi:MAG: M55 family metallopeptidase [Anaerolineae bacterium]
MVKILIWLDVEGISGVETNEMLHGSGFAETRELVTQDLLAAVRGVRRVDPGATIHVFDVHGKGGNLVASKLPADVRIFGDGWMAIFLEMVRSGTLRDYDGALLLGQHAATGTVDGFTPHTNTIFTALRVNGRLAGEAPQFAWLFGHFGVPVLLVTGDDAVVREVEALLPGITALVVKQALSRAQARSLPLADAHEKIERIAEKGMRERGRRKPYRLEPPIDVELLLATEDMAEMASRFPSLTRRGPKSVGTVVDDFPAGWLAYNVGRFVARVHILEEQLDLVKDLPDVRDRLRAWRQEIVRAWLEDPPPFPRVTY